MSDPRDDDLARDAHLRASLRHAPDAALGPPQSLSDAILAESRAKARSPRTPVSTRRNPLQLVWHLLGQPAVGASLAGVMVATVVGLMWWQGPSDEALPARPPVPAPAAPTIERQAQAPAVAALDPAPSVDLARKKPLAAEAEKKLRAPAPVQPAAAPPVAPSVVPAPAAALPPLAPAFPPPAGQAPAPMPEESAAVNGGAVAGPAQAEVAPRVAEAHAAAADAATAKSLPSPAEQQARQRFLESRAPDLAGLRATLSDESARWTWQPAGDDARPANDALRSWLAEVDIATRGSWRRVAAIAGPSAKSLQLLQDGRGRHLLQLEGDHITWTESDGVAWQALLPSRLQEGPAR
jgi:hypothetical protein